MNSELFHSKSPTICWESLPAIGGWLCLFSGLSLLDFLINAVKHKSNITKMITKFAHDLTFLFVLIVRVTLILERCLELSWEHWMMFKWKPVSFSSKNNILLHLLAS